MQKSMKLSGSLILNIVSTSTLRAWKKTVRDHEYILLEGISKELAKETAHFNLIWF